MQLTHAIVQGWAEAILAQLRVPTGHTLTVTGQGVPTDAGAETCPGAEGSTAAAAEAFAGLLVTLAFADGSSVSVHFEGPLPEAEAVTLLADQLQDAVLEETGGAPHPACPGHGHPAVARAVDGVACWTCPSGDAARPILPALPAL